MRNANWLRYGLASVVIVGFGMGGLLVACGDDDNGGGGGTDAGTDTAQPDTGTPDTGTPDTGPGDAGPPNAKITVVNAVTDLGPQASINGNNALRICFALGPTAEAASISPVPPLPDTSSNPAIPPGIYIGTGGALPSFGLDLEPFVVVPYAMNAAALFAKGIVKPGPGNPGTTCDELLKAQGGGYPDGGGPLVEGVDYWKLDPIPANTLKKGKSYVLVVTGCTGNAENALGKCGEGFAPDAAANKGNLKVRVYDVDRETTIGNGQFGVQFIHAAAPALTFLALNNIDVLPGITSDAQDAGAYKGVTGDGGPQGGVPVAYADKTNLAQVPGVNVATDSFILNPGAPGTAIPLPVIQAFSFPSGAPDGGEYRTGAAFTFIAVGDPGIPADSGVPGIVNTRAFHYLAFPNDPNIVTYQP